MVYGQRPLTRPKRDCNFVLCQVDSSGKGCFELCDKGVPYFKINLRDERNIGITEGL